MRARLFTDGGARGNPGPAAYGYVLEAADGTVLAAHGQAIGVATNNVAEYTGVVRALALAAELGLHESPAPFRPVLRGQLLTGDRPYYLRTELGDDG